MAMTRLFMGKLREILRLKCGMGLGDRQVAESCQTSHTTVGKYARLGQAAGVVWEQDQHLDDAELERKVLGAPVAPPRSKVVPDWTYVHTELKKKHVTLSILWEDYKETYKEAGYEFSFFRELYRVWEKKLRLSMRQVHRAGEKAFVDYCEGLWLTDIQTGARRRTVLFVGVWGASNKTYAEATMTEGLENWTMSHVRLFERSGCVPHIVVPDNLKSGVKDPDLYDPEINRTYLELARHYGFTVIPARPRKPQDKAPVECGVRIVQRWILARLRNRVFYSLSEMNSAINELLDDLNARKMRRLNRSRAELFETLDKPAALPLAEQRYEYALWKKCSPNIDYHVEVAKHYYSVPYQLRFESMFARITESVVELFCRNRRVASHARSRKEWYSSTLPEHMPPGHLAYMDQTPSKMTEWAGTVGENTQEVVKHILGSRKFIQQSYRACLGIKRLGQDYGNERLENACRRAVSYRAYGYRNIKAILAGGLDKQYDLAEDSSSAAMPAHGNIRGAGYYCGRKEDVN